MTTGNGLSTRSGHVFYLEEQLEKSAACLRQGAHLSIHGLPGTGRSTFVRQLANLEVREKLGLDQDCLMVLLDGQEFSDLSLEHIWGAIVTALNRARSSLSAICKEEDARKIGYGDLERELRSFRNYKLMLILDNCSDLHMEFGGSVCEDLLCLPKRHSPTLVMVPNPPSITIPPCVQEGRDQLVPIDLTLSPEQARQFLVEALPQSGVGKDIVSEFSHDIVDWVGGNLSLLDWACDWTIKLGENSVDVLLDWLSRVRHSGGRSWDLRRRQLEQEIALEERPGVNVRLAHPFFRRMV